MAIHTTVGRVRLVRRLLVGIALMALAVGCGTPLPSSVSGIITYKGKPLAGAVITLFGSNGAILTTETGPDGTYSVARVPRGTVRVSVQAPVPARQPGADAKPLPTPVGAVPLDAFPAKYGDPNTSGLKFNLSEATRTYSPDLD